MTNLAETNTVSGLKKEDFQATINGKQTDLYILRNSVGNEVAITNYGGAIVAIMVPDREGRLANVIQGHDNIQDVINSPEPYLSTLIGRYGNRIARGKFQLNGKEYQLAINNGPNCLHGGKSGWNARVWDARQMNDQTLVLDYVSPYGEEGFTGEVKVTV
ncbi:MAG: galactose-1-epimerase, partial [Prevotella sp.]|nr:galactose-1-epimerase [Prevotella sp.]